MGGQRNAHLPCRPRTLHALYKSFPTRFQTGARVPLTRAGGSTRSSRYREEFNRLKLEKRQCFTRCWRPSSPLPKDTHALLHLKPISSIGPSSVPDIIVVDIIVALRGVQMHFPKGHEQIYLTIIAQQIYHWHVFVSPTEHGRKNVSLPAAYFFQPSAK